LNTHRRALLALAVFAAAIVPAVAFAAAPSNDNFAAAMEIPAAGGTATSSNVDATAETGEPDHANSTFGALHSVWFKWTAPAGGTTLLDTCGSGFNTRLGVYTGSSVDALTEEVAADDIAPSSCGQPKFASASFGAVAGTTYWIAVDTSGGVPDDVSGPPQGEVKLTLDGPDVPTPPPPADDGTTTPGTPVPGKTISMRVPNLNPSGTAFANFISIWAMLEALKADGVAYSIDADPFPSKEAETNKQRQHLREQGKVGDILRGTLSLQNLDGSGSVGLEEGALVQIDTARQRLRLDVDFFSPDEDKKWLAQEKADLIRNSKDRLDAEASAREREEAKSKCLPIAADESKKQIEDRFPKWRSAFSDFGDAVAVFSKLGCDLVVDKYVPGKPTAPHAYVKELVRTDAKTGTIFVSIGVPGSHDFVFTIRENPKEIGSQPSKANIPIGTDGQLTVSDKQLNRVTVQVIERATGRLVSGIPVTFEGAVDPKKNTSVDLTQNTNGDGETTFVAKLTSERDHRIYTSFGELEGSVVLHAKDRGKTAFTSMSGRGIRRNSKGLYGGTGEDLASAQALPVVPAILGTGNLGAVQSIPVIQTNTVVGVDELGRQWTGPYNTIPLANNSQFLVGAAPGLVAVAGGSPQQTGRPVARRAGLANPLDFLGSIVGPLSSAWDQSVANIRTALSSAHHALIAQTAGLIGQAGGNVISDNGLGVISTGGGNVISVGGANVISVGGGNILSDNGLGLISDKGLGVIASGGLNLMPGHGGRLISDKGLG
jgi:hypothetical protein